MKRTTEWVCDCCESTAIVESTKTTDGTQLPSRWANVAMNFRYYSRAMYRHVEFQKTSLLCETCIDKCHDLNYFVNEDRDVLKTGIWKRIFNLGKTKQPERGE